MKKVLILEDEVSIRSFVVINLERAGYKAIEAGTGMEALEQLKNNPDIGVAILDTARIDALYRRVGGDIAAEEGELAQGPFLLNTRNRTLEKNGQRIKLTQVEYAIMKLFMQNPGRALSREDILSAVWGRDYDGELKIVDVNIRRLRIKIEDDTASPTYITTVWGYGYKWGA